MQPVSNNKRIAKNTLFLYIRTIFTMVVSLYTSRIVLATLGVDDFGIYNVVGGVVAMFSVFSGSLSVSISRFITYELGKGNQEKLKKVFSTAVSIQIFLAVCITILAEIIGIWFLNNKMNIPADRLNAANWVMHFSILAFAVNLISVPYNAAIIAHEEMSAFAYISILEVVLKLLIVYLLLCFSFDKLILYAGLKYFITLFCWLANYIYCKKIFSKRLKKVIIYKYMQHLFLST